jgi:hypothetical protein
MAQRALTGDWGLMSKFLLLVKLKIHSSEGTAIIDISMGISKPMKKSVVAPDVGRIGQKSTFHEIGMK